MDTLWIQLKRLENQNTYKLNKHDITNTNIQVYSRRIYRIQEYILKNTNDMIYYINKYIYEFLTNPTNERKQQKLAGL